jgi:hypothetical protein
MNLKRIFIEALERANADILIENGVLDISKQEHIEIIREHLINLNIDDNTITYYLNKMVEGRFPERQAYNANGILVTFPTPEYKQKAIARGSHFEENPKKGQVNVFSGDEQPKQNVEFEPEKTKPVQTTEPVQQPTSNRSEEEKEQDAQSIEKILTTEYTLEEALKFGFYNKKNNWYDASGNYIGKLWNVSGKQLIFK